jgi:hypothetical protein
MRLPLAVSLIVVVIATSAPGSGFGQARGAVALADPSAVVQLYYSSADPSVCRLLTPQALEKQFGSQRKAGETSLAACQRTVSTFTVTDVEVTKAAIAGASAHVSVASVNQRCPGCQELVGCREVEDVSLTAQSGAWLISRFTSGQPFCAIGAKHAGSTRGCTGSTTPSTGVAVPGYPVSFELPAGWAWVTYRSPASAVRCFSARYPIFDAQPLLSARQAFTFRKALGASFDSRQEFALSVASAGQLTLQKYISLALQQFAGVGAVVHGNGKQIVEISGVPAWRVRWSLAGWASAGAEAGIGSNPVTGTLQVVQYTFVRSGLIYLFTYRTIESSKLITTVFDPAARSIRFQ